MNIIEHLIDPTVTYTIEVCLPSGEWVPAHPYPTHATEMSATEAMQVCSLGGSDYERHAYRIVKRVSSEEVVVGPIPAGRPVVGERVMIDNYRLGDTHGLTGVVTAYRASDNDYCPYSVRIDGEQFARSYNAIDLHRADDVRRPMTRERLTHALDVARFDVAAEVEMEHRTVEGLRRRQA